MTKSTGTYLFLFVFALLATTTSFAANEIRTFSQLGMKKVLTEKEGQPFILVVWSIDCEPCMQELATLADLRQTRMLNVTLISTDGPENFEQVASTLAEFSLLDLDNWLFEQANSAKLRYQIDQDWFGELPRAYFYLNAESRLAYSGALTRDQINLWLDKTVSLDN